MSTAVLPLDLLSLLDRTMAVTPLPTDDPNQLYAAYCKLLPEHSKIEQQADGTIVVMPPTGLRSGYRNSKLNAKLDQWAEADGRGIVLDSSTVVVFPSGRKRVPDATWISHERLATISPERQEDFLSVVPEFVAEIRSRTDRLPSLMTKMEEYLRDGVSLGWLLDPSTKTVHIFSPDGSSAVVEGKPLQEQVLSQAST